MISPYNLNSSQVHRAYNMALVSLCDTGLIGLILMFLSVSLSGLLFTALVWCNSHTWIYFKHKGRYIKVDDQVQHSQNGKIGWYPISIYKSKISNL